MIEYDEKYECKQCGNKRMFYHDVSVEAKLVFDQKLEEELIIGKSDNIDNFFQHVVCYECNNVVKEYTD